ncbi:MAG: hypothetical protein K8S25_09460 [Alphaproteobacteria bacterium]|nr:hypothetical protein [Alphaproteobacteria bacterium]
MLFSALLSSFALGAALAWASTLAGYPVGWVGALIMISLATLVRRRWRLLADLAPESPERKLWVCLVGASAVAAHLAVIMLVIGPSMQMHTPLMHILGIDSWTLVAGALLAYLLVRDANSRSDERDQLIAHQARGFAWRVQFGFLSALILILGFGEGGRAAELSHPAIAHLLILVLTLTTIADCAHSLRAYRRIATESAE